jgi:glutamate-5-semialdehyde dehydrogenase
MNAVHSTLIQAKLASKSLISADRNAALAAMRAGFDAQTDLILQANAVDCARAKQSGISDALLDRLTLTPARMRAISESFLQVIALPDPLYTPEWSQIAEVAPNATDQQAWRHANGMRIRKVPTPFGVIGIVFESRPNVAADAAMLSIKAGSAVVLRGSSSALASNTAIVHAMQTGLAQHHFDPDVVSLLQSGERAEVKDLLTARGLVDLVIPRGSSQLIQFVIQHASVPVIETGAGICHLYVQASANLLHALAILKNGKLQRPGVCNSLETLLVDRSIAAEFLPIAFAALSNVQWRCCESGCAYVPTSLVANESDFATEHLDLILNCKIVEGFDEALAHIEKYSTGHSEVICTQIPALAQRFQQQVDAAAVYVNASTRFTDGFEFGFGAEIGISTQKLHARGPMGLSQMCSYKYLIDGEGQIR